MAKNKLLDAMTPQERSAYMRSLRAKVKNYYLKQNPAAAKAMNAKRWEKQNAGQEIQGPES